jgi:hypothetical protein
MKYFMTEKSGIPRLQPRAHSCTTPVYGVFNQSTAYTTRRDNMSKYEMQIRNTAQYYDMAMREAERQNIEILESFVPESKLHEIINNPVDSGIDEG